MESNDCKRGVPGQRRSAFSLYWTLVLYFALTFVSSWALWLSSGVLDYHDRLPPLDTGWLLAQVGVFCPSLWALAFIAVQCPARRRQCLLLLLGVFIPAALLGLVVSGQNVANPNDLPAAVKLFFPVFAAVILAVIILPRRMLLIKRSALSLATLRWSLAAAMQLPFFFLLAWLHVNLAEGDFGVGLFEAGASSPSVRILVLFSFDMIFGGALGEELGWRGFALPRLLGGMSPLRASLILGIVWSIWHLPIDLTAGFGAAGLSGIIFRLLFTGSLSVIVTWYFIHSGHGLLTSLLIHTTINWLPIMEFTGYEIAMAFLFGLMFLFSLLVILGDRRFRRGL